MADTLILVISSIGIGLSLLLAAVLFSKRNLSFFFLGLVFISFFLQLFEEIYWITGQIFNALYFTEFSEFSIFVIAPAFYLYLKYQVEKKFVWTNLLHFVPALLCIINFLPLYFSESTSKLCYINDKLVNQQAPKCSDILVGEALHYVKEKYLDIINIIQITLYLIFSYTMLSNLSKFKDKKMVGAYSQWSIVLLGLWLLAVILIFIDVFFIDSIYDSFSIIYLTSISAVLSFYLLNKSLLLSENLKSDNYSLLTGDEINTIVEQTKSYLQENDAFLNKSMSISSLSQEIDIPRNKIVHAFNHMDQDFKDVLNRMRIERSKKLLIENTEYKIEAIGEIVGYSSKATFYKYFKKYEGKTPSQFLDEV